MGFLLARCEHLHRRFVSVDHALSKHCFAQRIDQGLELHAGLADPLRQCRAGDGQAGAAEDSLLPIQRQVVGEFRHHHVSQQACGRDAFVDDLRRNGCLDQGFALTAGPFPVHMLLDGEDAGCVIQLLVEVLADGLKLAAASALGLI